MYNKLYQVLYMIISSCIYNGVHYNKLFVPNILILLKQQNKKKARNIYIKLMPHLLLLSQNNCCL